MSNYFSIPKAAKICSVSRATMHRWVTSGKIKSYSTAGGHKRILPDDLQKWMNDNGMPFHIETKKTNEIKILIVDDDVGVRAYLKKVLNGFFISIEEAADGFEAGIKMIQFQPDLLILDLFMPNMNGFEVCKKIKKDPTIKETKLIILSGHGTKENQKRAISLGADAFLNKPSSKKEIIDCVEKLLQPG